MAPGDYILDVSPSAPGGMPDFFKQTEFASVKLSVGTEDLTGLVVTTGPGPTVDRPRDLRSVSSPRPRTPPYHRCTSKFLDGSPGMRSPSADREQRPDCRRRYLHGEGRIRKDAVQSRLAWLALEIGVASTARTSPTCPTTRAVEISRISRSWSPISRQELKGTVVDASGKPVTRFVVVVFPSELPEGAVPGRFLRLLSPRTDGTFDINNLPSGNYLAAAFETIDQDIQWNPALREAIRPRATPFIWRPGKLNSLNFR